MDFKEIGRRLRQVRGKIKQKEWAETIGCQQAYVSQVENGITKPSLDYLVKASQITGVSIDEILGIQKEPVESEKATLATMQIKDEIEPYFKKKEELIQKIKNLLQELSDEKLNALYTLLK
jgi:transcriptional regulator with XRE-family HTH domain